MKTYKVVAFTPTSEDEYEDACDIMNLPSLKYGTVDYIYDTGEDMTKKELMKYKKTGSCFIEQRFYDYICKVWRNGILIQVYGKKIFVEYDSNY